MNIKSGAISLLCSIIWLSSNAQVEKQVEVTKAYIPQIEPTQKLRLEPDMSDTVRLRPEIDYTITPRTISTMLSTRYYKPATVTYWDFNRPERWYLKAGIGVPLSSVADVYVSNSNPNTNYFIGYINHQGEYAKIDNDYNQKHSTKNTQNRIGGVAGMYIRDQILQGEVSYDLDYWTRYATNAPIIKNPTYQTASATASYGDQFINFDRWNYLFDLDASYLFNGEGDNNTSLGFIGKFGGRLGVGKLISEVGCDYIVGNYNYMNYSVLFSSTYDYSLNRFNIGIGAQYIHDYVSTHTDSSHKNYVIPNLHLKYTATPKIQPFVEVIGGLSRNNYASLTKINPYIAEGAFVDKSSVDYSFRAGIDGVLGDEKFRYNIFADYTITTNALYWALIEEEYEVDMVDNYYGVTAGKLQSMSMNLEAEYRPIGGLTIDFGGVVTKYTTSQNSGLEASRPAAKAHIGVSYETKVMKYGVSADMEGVRYTTLITNAAMSSVQTPITVDVKAFVEYTLKSDITLFLEASNLANADLYNWMGYREYGVGAVAGIKMQF